MPTQRELNVVVAQTPNNRKGYNLASWWTSTPIYSEIMIDAYIRATHFSQMNHSEKLDPVDKTNTAGTKECAPLNICVPKIHVPDVTSNLGTNLGVDAQGRPIDKDVLAAENISAIADSLGSLAPATLKTSEPLDVGEITFSNKQGVASKGYTDYTKDGSFNFKDISSIAAPLVTDDSVECRPETVYEIPEIKEIDWNTEGLQDLKNKIEELTKLDVFPDIEVRKVTNNDFTDRTINGDGIFDWMSKAFMNQLENAKNSGLLSSDDVAQIFSQGIMQAMQVAANYALERERTYWGNKLQFAQVAQANAAIYLAQAELIMLPQKVEIAQSQLKIARKEVELKQFQLETQKLQIPLMAAQLDQVREQTKVICTQNKQALEQLAQAELDRKLKRVQVENAAAEVTIKQHQANQAEIATEQQLVALENSKEQVKVTNAQWQFQLKQVTAADVQIKQTQAEIKLKAQQLLRDKEQVALIKAQTASAYANVAASTEAIRAAKAQYSDTIEGEEIGGLLGSQIRVHKMQAEAFDRDSFYKFANLVASGWQAKKTADIATLSPNAFTAFGVDRVMAHAATNLFNMPADAFELPSNYTDYLSDAQMDGNSATGGSTHARV